MDNKNALLGIAFAALLIVGGLFVYTQFFSSGLPGGPGNIQVQVQAYLREDLGANAVWQTIGVDVYRGTTLVETVTSTTAGLLTFANMYWVGEKITVQVRAADPGTIANTQPYLMPAVDIIIPASAESGDTVSLGVIWGRDPATSVVLTCTNQTGGTIDDTTAHMLEDSDTELRCLLHTMTTTDEGWGCADEVTDLRSGFKYVGGIIVLSTSAAEPVSNYKWHFSGVATEYYIIQVGAFVDDSNIPDDGTKFAVFTFNAALTATATVGVDAYDCTKFLDMQNCVFGGTPEVSTCAAIATEIHTHT